MVKTEMQDENCSRKQIQAKIPSKLCLLFCLQLQTYDTNTKLFDEHVILMLITGTVSMFAASSIHVHKCEMHTGYKIIFTDS